MNAMNGAASAQHMLAADLRHDLAREGALEDLHADSRWTEPVHISRASFASVSELSAIPAPPAGAYQGKID